MVPHVYNVGFFLVLLEIMFVVAINKSSAKQCFKMCWSKISIHKTHGWLCVDENLPTIKPSMLGGHLNLLT